MFSIFQTICRLWNKYGFEILSVLSIVILTFLAIMRKGKRGTWTDFMDIDQYMGPLGVSLQKRGKSFLDSHEEDKGSKDSKGEIECRRVLRSIFAYSSFDKHRPDFLRNPVTGNCRNLELDCYEPSLRIAVEYNGAQHYKYIPYFHRTKDAFTNQKYRDEMKRRLCMENGITLIEVPYTVKLRDIDRYIRTELRNYSALP